MEVEVRDKSNKKDQILKKPKYEYVELLNAKLNKDGGPCHFYGVIIDATYPYKKMNAYRFICSLKVIDLTMN